MQEKFEFRKTLLAKRLGLSRKQAQESSDKIIKKLINYINWQEINNINTYRTLKSKNEIEINALLNFLNNHHPSIIIDITDNKISSAQNIPIGKKYDLVIVPLLGFDRAGNRLGYGGGYYDKFLAKNNCKQTIGLAYSFQEVESLPVEPYDQNLDLIITEQEVIKP